MSISWGGVPSHILMTTITTFAATYQPSGANVHSNTILSSHWTTLKCKRYLLVSYCESAEDRVEHGIVLVRHPGMYF
jgi:hypothetical protein